MTIEEAETLINGWQGEPQDYTYNHAVATVIDAAKDQQKLHHDLIGATARLLLAGVNPREKLELSTPQMWAVIEAGQIVHDLYLHIPLPKACNRLQDCNEFTNQMATEFFAGR